MRFPDQVQPDRGAVADSLALLNNWRCGSAATAVVMAGLLPFAVAWHVTYVVAIAVSLMAALTLAVGCRVVCQRRLATLAMFPGLAQLPELAGKCERLVSTHPHPPIARRRAAAASGSVPATAAV